MSPAWVHRPWQWFGCVAPSDGPDLTPRPVAASTPDARQFTSCCLGAITSCGVRFPVPTYRAGRHEFGQNFLTDRRIIATMVDLVRHTGGPIVEFGPGRGALTLPLQQLGRPITAVEIDEAHARYL